jgi:hypothetical protein
MPAAKMTVAFLEARHGFQQDQDREVVSDPPTTKKTPPYRWGSEPKCL